MALPLGQGILNSRILKITKLHSKLSNVMKAPNHCHVTATTNSVSSRYFYPNLCILTNILQYFNKNASSFNGNNTLHHGASKNFVDILKMSLEQAINIEEKNMEGNTPSHLAAAAEYIEPMKFFTENGSNIEEKNLEGNTPIHIAVATQNEKLLKFLIENGSNVEEKNLVGNTPLHIAAASDNDKIVKCLIQNGASSTQFTKNNAGQIPYEVAKHNDYI